MGKSTHFIGQPVYNQVIKLLDKQQIKKISLETPRSESYVKRLDGWTHLVIMLFGVLKHFDSLREVEIGMKAEVNKLHHLASTMSSVVVRLLMPTSVAHKSSLQRFMRTS
ncbi:DUF4372 domain-containing protein [Prevotella intermedia]|uniref:DUF4372 domain-containing protein n=1 Tax=Prevotella intermedia TaxID=28131 RepID=UPI00211E9DD4|nr:DUF4372 domain-containing protein [Prevotella intermedia]